MLLWFVFYLENNSFLYYYASNTITQTFSSYGKTPNFKQKLIYKLLWAKSLLITLRTLAHFWVFNMNTKYSPKVFTQIAGGAAVIERCRWYLLQDQAALEAESHLHGHLHPWSVVLKCVPRTNSIRFTWELGGNAKSQHPHGLIPTPSEPESSF